ncbi:MAG TPA: RDD family protein, partial [Anaerolineales bacterium]|nr:RDD family protein [Anaerolineales bacterium]
GSVAGIFLAMLYALLGVQASLQDSNAQLVDCLASLVLSAAYATFFEGLYGSTPGKLILGMRVVKEDGSRVGLDTALVRALTRFIDGLVFGLPAYLAMKPPLHQRIGDKMAKTLVVGRRDPGTSALRPWWWFLVAAALYGALACALAIALLSTMIRPG